MDMYLHAGYTAVVVLATIMERRIHAVVPRLTVKIKVAKAFISVALKEG
tara:strand:- start:434 stop:580 length:147 start_codon:yes stop_codon:yes gene_type:complete